MFNGGVIAKEFLMYIAYIKRSSKLSLLFATFFWILNLHQAYGINYTPHEKNFYKTQVRFIKNSWEDLIKNESRIFLNTDSLLKKGRRIFKYEKQIKTCQSWKDYTKIITKLDLDLAEVERESYLLLSTINKIDLDKIEKTPSIYTLFIKRISEINQKISEIRIYTINLNEKKETVPSWQIMREKYSADMVDLIDRLHHLVDTFPQITLKTNVKSLLSLGQTEFINTLSEDISETMIGNYHKMDIVFNSVNRDLLKTENLLSNGSKGHLLRIHQRWNAILKIIKRK